MNFNQIIKQEWEKEFPLAADLCTYENSLAIIYDRMIKKICVRVWNEAIDMVADNAEADYEMSGNWNVQVEGDIECYVIKDSILKYKL